MGEKSSMFLCSEMYIGNHERVSYISDMGIYTSFNIRHISVFKVHPLPAVLCSSYGC